MEIRIHPSHDSEDLLGPQEEFTLVERVARIVSSVRSVNPDYTRLAVELEQAIPCDVFGVVLLRHDGKAVRITVCQRAEHRTTDAAWVASYHQHPFEGSMLEQVMSRPRLSVEDAIEVGGEAPATRGDALSGYPQLRSTLIVPLVVVGHREGRGRQQDDRGDRRVLGALEFGSYRAHTYNNPQLQRLVEAVADVLATAIERVQLGGSAEIQNRQRQALKDVSSALTAEVELSTILHQIVVGIEQALNVASALLLFDQDASMLRLEAQAGLDEAACAAIFGEGMPISEQCVLGYSLIHRQPALLSDAASDEQFPHNRILARSHGLRSIYSYPLMTGSTVYGLLVLFSPEVDAFTPLKMDIFSLFASQASVAIHNGMLLESARQRRRFQDIIEQLERADMSKREALQRGQSARDSATAIDDEAEEARLLAHMREETRRLFGISFSSLLRFMSDHLLTQDERNVRLLLQKYIEKDTHERVGESGAQEQAKMHLPEQRSRATAENLLAIPTHKLLVHDTLDLLTRTAEAALVRVGMLGELGSLLLQLRQSADSVKDAWFVVDLDGACIYMNPAAEALCGIRVETVPNLSLEQIFSGLFPRMRNADEVSRYLQEFLRGGVYQQDIRCVLATEPIKVSPVVLELEQKARQYVTDTKKNSLRLESAPSDYHYQLVRYPLHSNNGQLVGSALQMLDVTEQVRDEKNRSALLSSVSHDLKTPLTTIKAAVSGLLQPGVPWSQKEMHEMLEDIESETDHLTVLISALVELSRIEMGALHLEKEWCDIVEIIHGAVKKAERMLVGRPVHVQGQPFLPLVYVDHVQMERVIYNLLENATRHDLEKTELLIEVDLQEQQGAPSTEMPLVRVKVTDHGSGVSVYERERMFKSFNGVRSSSNGLGLAICKGIIEAHHGRIWVEGPAKAPLPSLSKAQSASEERMLQKEEDIVTRVTKKLEQQHMREGICFIFTLPTSLGKRAAVEEPLLCADSEQRSPNKRLSGMSSRKDSVLEGSNGDFTSEESR